MGDLISALETTKATRVVEIAVDDGSAPMLPFLLRKVLQPGTVTGIGQRSILPLKSS
jgi:hypothetical protein